MTSDDLKMAECPACGAKVKASESMRSKRVRCPKCRKVVVLDPPQKAAPASKSATPAKKVKVKQEAPGEDLVQARKRIESLETRVETLEKALADVSRLVAEEGTEKKTERVIADLPPIAPPEPPAAPPESSPKKSPPPPMKFPLTSIPGKVAPAKTGIPAPAPASEAEETASAPPQTAGFRLPPTDANENTLPGVPRMGTGASVTPPKKNPVENSNGKKVRPVLLKKDRHQIIVQLKRYPDRQICIKAAAGDGNAHQFAEELKSTFVEAGWTVEGILQTGNVEHSSRLVLSTGTFPVPKEVAVAFRALASVGLEPASQLDPNQFKDQAVLIVNAPSRKNPKVSATLPN